MATTIATAYVQIMPSFKGAKAAIESELAGSVSAPLEKEAAATAPKVGAKLGSEIAAGVGTGVTKGIGSALDGATTGTGGLVAKARTMSSAISSQIGGIGVASAAASSPTKMLGKDLESLAGKATSIGAVRNAASGLVGSLGGLAGLIGYGGPLGIALAAGTIAWDVYATAQKNAKDAADAFSTTLNATSGAATLTTYQKAITDFRSQFSDADLKAAGVTFDEILNAVVKQGPALDAVRAKAAAYHDQLMQSFNPITRANANALTSSIDNLTTDLNAGTEAWQINKAATDAAARQYATASGDAASLTGVLRVQNEVAQSLAVGGLTIFQTTLDSISASAQKVTDRINAVPHDVTITAKSAGIDKLIADLNTIISRYVAMAAAISNVNQIAVDGERHGADVGATSLANKFASQGLAAAAAAAAATQKALAVHNTAAVAAQNKTNSGLANARTRLLDDISGSFLADLVAASPSQIKSTIDKLITGVRAALSGHSETSLVAFLRKDNTALDSLAKRRDDITQRISDAQTTFTQAKASATPDLLNVPHSGPGLVNALSKQLDTLRRFHSNLVLLSKRGLPKVFLQQLINAGLDGAQAAMDLASGSAGDFAQIRSLTNALDAESSKYANDATSALYGVGVNSGKGIIAGLQSQEAAIEAQMSKIGTGMVKAIKKALGIHSPSQVFRTEVGVPIADGTMLGLEDRRAHLDKAVAGLVNPSSARLSLAGGTAGARGPAIGELHLHNTTDGTVMGGVTHALRVADWYVGASA